MGCECQEQHSKTDNPHPRSLSLGLKNQVDHGNLGVGDGGQNWDLVSEVDRIIADHDHISIPSRDFSLQNGPQPGLKLGARKFADV